MARPCYLDQEEPMRIISCQYPIEDIKFLERLIEKENFETRSEALRYALRSLKIEYEEHFLTVRWA